jgi:S1-C subfamily serine protease
MLVTIASSAYNARAFMPPSGSGYWGVDNLRRVPVEGTKMHGVKLGDVSANRPADIAGLKEGDIVVEFDGLPVRTRNGLVSYIDHAAPGTTVNVTVIRDGQRIDIPVKTGKD